MKHIKQILFIVFTVFAMNAYSQYEQQQQFSYKRSSDGVRFLTKESFDANVKKPRVITIVEFWAGWNEVNQCTFLKKISGVKVFRVDMEASPDLGLKYGISVVPTILVFDGGKLREKFEGNLMFQLPPDVNKKALQNVVDDIIGEKF
tara:strand:+ start:855 stop:1295 length:441 start_codon:yes stop_codon:yes gene_type:complete